MNLIFRLRTDLSHGASRHAAKNRVTEIYPTALHTVSTVPTERSYADTPYLNRAVTDLSLTPALISR